jgi:hypothetical protein
MKLLAERSWTTPALIATGVATAALLLIPRGSCEKSERPAPKRAHRCSGQRPTPPPSSCPAAVRATVGLDDTAAVACLKASVGEPAYFVFGHYTTTEAWERIGVVSADGSRILTQFVDRPSRRNQGFRLGGYATLDVNSDGRAEAVATWIGGIEPPLDYRHEVVSASPSGGEPHFAIGPAAVELCELRIRGAEVLSGGPWRDCTVQDTLAFDGTNR